MFAAILALLLLPVMDISRSRGMQFRPLSKVAFYAFVANFLILLQLGAKHVESPFIEFGQITTLLYFLYFALLMYSVTLIENTTVEISLKKYIGIAKTTYLYLFTTLDRKTLQTFSVSSFFSFGISLEGYEIENLPYIVGLVIAIAIAILGIVYMSTNQNAVTYEELDRAVRSDQCKHPKMDRIDPTARELAAGQHPVCDFQGGMEVPCYLHSMKHEAITPNKRHYYACRSCMAVACTTCKSNQGYAGVGSSSSRH